MNLNACTRILTPISPGSDRGDPPSLPDPDRGSGSQIRVALTVKGQGDLSPPAGVPRGQLSLLHGDLVQYLARGVLVECWWDPDRAALRVRPCAVNVVPVDASMRVRFPYHLRAAGEVFAVEKLTLTRRRHYVAGGEIRRLADGALFNWRGQRVPG